MIPTLDPEGILLGIAIIVTGITIVVLYVLNRRREEG